MVMDFLEAQLVRTDPWNCSTMVADWLIDCGYPDFAADFRSITDPEACEAVATAHGGLGALWEKLFAGDVPWACEPYQPGDVGVVETSGYEAGAIYTGQRWALRQAHGLLFVASPEQVAVSRAWRP